MTDRPILFSAPMIRGLIREVEQPGTGKTQTRRIVKPQPTMHEAGDCSIGGHRGDVDYLMREIYPKHMARFRNGDRLWVREAWRCNGWASDVATIFYRASEGEGYTAMCEQWPVADHKPLRVEPRWSPSLHLPRWASRLTLTVTDVRVQRVQEISEEDARAEGALRMYMDDDAKFYEIDDGTYRCGFCGLWAHINGIDAWDSNPWIVALTFTVERRNIDAVSMPYLIWSNVHGAWWGPNHAGYYTDLSLAGRYTREEAIAQCATGRDGFTAHRTPQELPVREIDALNRADRAVDQLVLKADRAECRARDLARKAKAPA